MYNTPGALIYMENRFSYMKPRYSLWKSSYREGPRTTHVLMSGAIAQKIRRAMEVGARRGRKEKVENGVRAGERLSPTLPPHQPGQSLANSVPSKVPTNPSSESQTASEGDGSSSRSEVRNPIVGTVSRTSHTIARSHSPHPGWGGLVPEEIWD